MNFKVDDILNVWRPAVAAMNKSVWFSRLLNGELDVRHYKGFLLETYHHAGLNPQIQAFATLYFKTNHRNLFERFYKHAISEIGHDMLAMNDLKALGEDVAKLQLGRPQPETIAFNAYVIHQIQFNNPLCYLGYLFHLEFLPTQNGPGYAAAIGGMGVPPEALSFLQEHSTIDIGHNKLMETYIRDLVRSEEDFNLVINAALDSCRLHQLMLEAAMANGEKIFKK